MVKITKRKAKRCLYCSSLDTIKHGVRKDIKKPVTRYLCKKCHKTFQEKRRKTKKKISEEIFKKYFWNKKTLKEISEEYNLSSRTIQKLINNYQVKIKKKKPRKVNLIIDVVFFSKRKFHTAPQGILSFTSQNSP